MDHNANEQLENRTASVMLLLASLYLAMIVIAVLLSPLG